MKLQFPISQNHGGTARTLEIESAGPKTQWTFIDVSLHLLLYLPNAFMPGVTESETIFNCYPSHRLIDRYL